MDSLAKALIQPRRRITVLQGQVLISAEPWAEFTTVLGSCVATCLFDREAKVGGVNHFLLALPPASHVTGEADPHYGVYLMSELLSRILAAGASRQRLRAHLYGGANLHPGMAPIGTRNAIFSRAFLRRERIALEFDCLGGMNARRIQFRPTLGKVRYQIVRDHSDTARPGSSDDLLGTKRGYDDD